MRKIAIVGPECSGKTTLTEELALQYHCAYTREYARTYLEQYGPSYDETDLLHIAGGQLLVEAEAQRLVGERGGDLVLCDTDMITIRIWSEEKYGRCQKLIRQLAERTYYDLWLLCKPDIPWEMDPLRENPDDRDRLFEVYVTMLKRLDKPFTVISGERDERLRSAKEAIDRIGH